MLGVYSWFVSPQTEVKSSSTLATTPKEDKKEDKIGNAAKESFGPFTQDLTKKTTCLKEQQRNGQVKVDLRVQGFHTHLDEI